MGWGDPGGPGDNDMGGGRGSSRGGGRLGSELGTVGRGNRGYGSGHSANGRSGGRLGSELGTVGRNNKGYGSGHSADGSSGTGSRAELATQTRTEARRSVYGEVDTPSQASVTSGMVTDQGMVAARSFMDRLNATPMSTEEATRQAQKNIDQQASAGLIGNALSLAAGVVNPMAGLAINTAARGYNASQMAERHNAEFGTNVDTGLASNIGRQAVGGLAGFAGGKVGGRVGGIMGSTMGPYGALAGGLIGNQLGQNLGTGLANGTIDVGSPTSSANVGTPTAGDSQYASDTIPATSQPQAPTTPAMPNYGPANLNNYASYAQSFFA